MSDIRYIGDIWSDTRYMANAHTCMHIFCISTMHQLEIKSSARGQHSSTFSTLMIYGATTLVIDRSCLARKFIAKAYDQEKTIQSQFFELYICMQRASFLAKANPAPLLAKAMPILFLTAISYFSFLAPVSMTSGRHVHG